MKLPTLSLSVAVLFAVNLVQFGVFAQSNIVTLTVEQSTNGLASWTPIQAFTNTDSSASVTNLLCRARITMVPLSPNSNMITIEGGDLPQSSQLAGTSVSTFQIGKYEVTWDEWQEVRAWAVDNGYSDLVGVGQGSAGSHPVRDVSYNDAVKWINAKSEKEMLLPAYRDGDSVYRYGYGRPPSLQGDANGYRLPTEAEWEWAARGGIASQGYTYSGSDDPNLAAWYRSNSIGAVVNLGNGMGTWPVGQKAPNELGLHDMSGNVWEYTVDTNAFVSSDGFGLNLRGGGWNTGAGAVAVAQRSGSFVVQDMRSSSIGFRVARNAPATAMNSVALTLEQSTNGLSNWQASGLAFGNRSDGRVVVPAPTGSAFYRLNVGRPVIDPLAPAIAVSPNVYSNSWTIFSYNRFGDFDYFPVTISNTGGSNLVVTGVYRTSNSSNYQYSLDSSNLTIPPGQSAEVLLIIELRAGLLGSLIHDRISIISNAASGSSIITIRGSYYVDSAGGGAGP